MRFRHASKLGLCTALLVIFAAGPGRSADEPEEGFQWNPNVEWKKGDHEVDLWVKFRYRFEVWNARASREVFPGSGTATPAIGWTGSTDVFHDFRTRFGASYSWKERVTLLVEGQQAAVVDLSHLSSGIGGAYFNNNGRHSTTSGVNLKRLFLDVKPTENTQLRGGRMNLNMGTWVKYKDPAWKYVKYKRMSQRLVGEVGWTTGTRSFDGGYGAIDIKGQAIRVFAAQPTRGVFEIRDAMKQLSDVVVGGIEWTSPAGALLDNIEFGAFFTGYGDDRFINEFRSAPSREKVDLEIYTIGGSALGIFPIGPGALDAMIWGAFQFGSYQRKAPGWGVTYTPQPGLEHRAGALLAEVGYQLREVYGKPWLRTGVNYASGDGNSFDGVHSTFFNMLPTNHLYYGFVDQLAFQNLVNWFMQLKWSPFEKTSLNIFGHRYWLASANDARWFGTGAFSPNSFGYGSSPSQGSNDVGWELDIILDYKVNRWVSLTAGYGQLFGGAVFAAPATAPARPPTLAPWEVAAGTWGNDGNVQFGFVQAVINY
jgi:hypothetical protein